MFENKSILTLAIAALGLTLVQGEAAFGRGLISPPPPGPCEGGTCTINCATETIGEVLANAAAGPGGRLTIIVNGNCTEDLTIERDRVTLKDGTLTGTGADQPVIEILGARGIVIDNMTVQDGASHGILATRSADVTVVNTRCKTTLAMGFVRNGEPTPISAAARSLAKRNARFPLSMTVSYWLRPTRSSARRLATSPFAPQSAYFAIARFS
jgi:hypothetical protein